MKKGRKKRIMVGIILVLLGIILVYWNIPYSRQKSVFKKKMQFHMDAVEKTESVVTKEEIEQLPLALQRYCSYIGLEGFPKYQVVRAVFKDTDFVFDAKSGKVLKMDYDLWLFYDKWFRSAYCQSSMYGVPFEGEDYCTDDLQGGMKGVLGKSIQIFDECSSQGYQAGFISWFAESLVLNPSVLFAEYVTYEEMDDNTVKVIIRDGNVVGEGVVYIDDKGEITSFYSDDRQVEDIEGNMTKIGWRCEYSDYQKNNGIMQPGAVRGVKVFKDKEVVYFSSDNLVIEYKK